MEERQGWERPGWFLKNKTVTILPYKYDTTISKGNDEYRQILETECTFDFPLHHNIVNIFIFKMYG